MLDDRILDAEQSVTRIRKSSRDQQHFIMALTGLDRCSKSPNLINMIVLNVFFKLLLWESSTHTYFNLKVLGGG